MGGCRSHASEVLRAPVYGHVKTTPGYDVTTCNSCGNEQSSRNDSRFCAFCGAELFARPVAEPRPTSVRSPWWEEIDAPPPRVTSPSLPVPAATPAPAEPVTAPLTMNAVPLVASVAPPSVRSQAGDAPLSPEPVARTALVPEEGPSSEAHAPSTALLEAAFAATADDTVDPVRANEPAATDDSQTQPLVEEAPSHTADSTVVYLAPRPPLEDQPVSMSSDADLAPGELAAVDVPPGASEPPIDEPPDLRSETPTVTLHIPFGGQNDTPTATLTWPGLAPARREQTDLAATEPEAPAPGPERSEAAAASLEPESPTVEIPAARDVPPVAPAPPPAAERDAAVHSAPKTDPTSSATPDPIGVGLVSPIAGSHGSLADTWSRFLPTPSELRSVRMAAPESPGKATQPKSVSAPISGEDEWSGLNESERDVAEFQSLFRARFGRAATASVDGNVRLHRPVIAFERQLAARRQLERPSEGASALVSRSPDRATTNGVAEVRRPADTRPPSGDTSFGSTGVRRGTVDRAPAEGLLSKEPVKLRPFRVPTPDAPAPRAEQVQTQSWSPPPSANPTPPVVRPPVAGEDDIPELPSDWKPRQ